MKQAVRTLSLTVALVMLAVFLPLSGNGAFTAHADGSGDFIIEGGWLSGYTGKGGDIVIPDSVQYIDTEAFSGCTTLTSVVIPASVRQIGDYAFYGCTGLKTVTVSGKVNYFGTDAFGSCPNLTAFLTSDGNNFYVSENGVLYNADQTTLMLCPNGKKGAFTIPSTVTDIDGYAFSGCAGLTSVTVPDSVKHIYGNAFSGCTGLTGLALPDAVELIEGQAFSGCTGLTSFRIPSSVTEIGWCTFENCTGLKSVTLSPSVSEIGVNAFLGCVSLTAFQVENSNSVYSAANGVLYNADKTTLVRFPEGKKGAFTVPSTVTTIGATAFESCTGLTGVTFPSSVTIIDRFAFDQCSGLTSVTLPGSLTEIHANAFAYCTGLTAITLPDAVTSVGEFAFSGCVNLTSVTLDDALEELGWMAFADCEKLTAVHIPASVTELDVAAFDGCTSLRTITVDPNSEDYADEDGVLYTKEKTMLLLCPKGRQGAVTLPDTVREIYWDAFAGCTGITRVTLPASLTAVGGNAFSGCDSLTDVYYKGTEGQWDEIEIMEGNAPLEDATRRYAGDQQSAITRQPADASGAVGDKVTFSVEAEGEELSYQWYYRKAGDESFTRWANHTAPSATLQVYASWHGAEFYCIVFDSQGNALTSETATLTVLPKITQQPADASGAVNDTAAFTVKATGNGLTYQWYYCKEGTPAFTAWNKKTSASVSTPIYSSWNKARFYCLVTDANGQTAKSAAVTLTVTPRITQQPKDVSGKVNDTATFTVKATGAGLSYQWYMKKANDSAFTAWNKRTSASVSTPIYNSWNGAQFYCVVKDANGKTVQSNTVKLTVAASLAITAQPSDVSGNVSGTAKFSVTAAGSGLTYQWYYKKSGESTFTAWNKKTAASVSTPIYASWNKAQFYCVVKDASGKTVQSDTVTLTVTPAITAQPANASGAVNGTAKFSLTATGAGLTYQWYYKKAGQSDWTKWNGQTRNAASLTIYRSWNNAQFYCVVKDSSGKTVNSDTATLTVK